jgi:hypothetical protein
VGGSQGGCILHVRFEVPKLLQAHSANVDNVVALRYGRLGVLSVDGGAQRLHESDQGLIQGEQTEVLGRDLGRCGFRRSEMLLIGRDVLRVERCDFKEIDGDAALVTTAEPLGVLRGRLDGGLTCREAVYEPSGASAQIPRHRWCGKGRRCRAPCASPRSL